jgi:uncharacterized DUF497 family protein
LEFEFDHEKSESNRRKHGIEQRLRIISVRRSRPEEIELYEDES